MLWCLEYVCCQKATIGVEGLSDYFGVSMNLGKTATLKAIKALFGDCSGLQRGKVSTEALIKKCSVSSIPLPIDDISSSFQSEEIAVTFFNGTSHMTVSGTKTPQGTVIMSSNNSFVESERWM